MNKMKRLLAILLLTILTGTMILPVQAASKKTMYVVSSIKEKGVLRSFGKDSYTVKVTYTKKGLIKKINIPCKEGLVYTFTYNKKNRLTKFVEEIKNGDFKCVNTYTYTYKDGKLKTRTLKSTNGDTEKRTYDYKNGYRVLSNNITTWKENGKTETEKSKETATYKNGHVKTLNRVGIYSQTYSMDSRGNYTKYVLKAADGTIIKDGYLKASMNYDKNNRITKRVVAYKNPMMDREEKITQTVKYKKITVDKKYAAMIEAQQWQLLNTEGVPTGATSFCEAW